MEKSSKTLVIIAHPSLNGTSRVHKRWARELAEHPDEFCVHDLYACYPDGVIDEAGVAREQELLAAHDLVVLEFPVYWYSSPALLRTWADEVYSFGWAYGGEDAFPGEPGRMVAGKRFACAVSAGDLEEHYAAGAPVGFTMDEVLAPFYATANYLGATYEPHAYVLYGTESGISDAEVDESARGYVEWLRGLRK